MDIINVIKIKDIKYRTTKKMSTKIISFSKITLWNPHLNKQKIFKNKHMTNQHLYKNSNWIQWK